MSADGSTPLGQTLQAMADVLSHRGPDGLGKYSKGDTSLIHRRLAIIDLVTGDQPFIEPAGAALVANGEIYNYLELRNSLRDVTFSTRSDCELPLHIYRRKGIDFARELRGMYAIAIHDPSKNWLVLARDPFGIKPLYYSETELGFAFASEPQALIESGWVKRKIYPAARDELLQLKYTTGPRTIFEGINRVLPGETLIISKGRIAERLRIDALADAKIDTIDSDTACKQFTAIWTRSVEIHQRSDVPYGLFLSGGIDSSAILAMMANVNSNPVRTFTIGFPSSGVVDERAHAREVARHVGAEHIDLSFDEEDFWKYAPQAATVLDDPTADYAALPLLKLAAAAKNEGLKVILCGEGGDELFGGYGRYRRAMRPLWLGGGPRFRGALEKSGVLRRERKLVVNIAITSGEFGGSSYTKLQTAQAIDCANWLPNDLLLKLDRCLMRYGIEGRTPFLDPVIAKFAFSLPDTLKVRNGLGKWLPRQWLNDNFPIAEPFTKKRGFTVPVGEWISKRGNQLGALVASQDCIKELCYPDEVISLFKNATDGKNGMAAWVLLFYALWYRRHISGHVLPENVFDALDGSISSASSWHVG